MNRFHKACQLIREDLIACYGKLAGHEPLFWTTIVLAVLIVTGGITVNGIGVWVLLALVFAYLYNLYTRIE